MLEWKGRIFIMEELVSIILPVYNGEEYIEQSINSVLDQTYQNFELIIVDNNSTDKTISIIQKFSDKRINLLFCEEKGVSRARNLGLDHAKGNFITFIDADDKFDKKHIEFLIQNYNKFDNVYLSVSSVTSDLSEYKKISYKKHCPKSFVRQNFFESIIMDNHISGFVWNKMYRRDLIEKNKLRFSENILIKEDLIFNLLYLTFEREKSIVFSDIPTYFYFRHSDSATSKKRDKNEYQKYMMSIVNANELVLDILGKKLCSSKRNIFHKKY